MNSQPPGSSRAGRKPFPALRRPSSIIKPATSTTSTTSATPPKRTTPHRHDQSLFYISTTYSTITARAQSFQGLVITGVTPLQLAQNGFHYQPHESSGGLACCFACQSAKPLKTFQRTPIDKSQQLHLPDCIWQVIQHDLKPHFAKPDTFLHIQPTPRLDLPSDRQPLETTASDSNTQVQTPSTPTVPMTVEDCSNASHKSPAELPSATPNPNSQSPQPAPSIQPSRPSTATCLQNQQPTYASVLQQSTTSTTRSPSDPHLPPSGRKPTLTIEDLHHRFHGRLSPFALDKRRKKRPKAASAVQSLSKFLNSTLPAFSRFLTEMQPAADNCWPPPYLQTHHSRATRAA